MGKPEAERPPKASQVWPMWSRRCGAAHSRRCKQVWMVGWGVERDEGPDEITLPKVKEGWSKEGRAGPAGQLGKRRIVSIRRGQKRGARGRGKAGVEIADDRWWAAGGGHSGQSSWI